MPFEPLDPTAHPGWWTDGGKTTPEILLRQIDRTRFQLEEGFRYQVPGGQSWEVPPNDLTKGPAENNSTDLASAPQLLWWFFASYGLHTRAALFHDHFVDAPDPDGEGPNPTTRHRVDRVFELALEESGVRWLRRKLIWTAVSLRTSLGTVGFGLVLAHLLLLGVATAYWAFGDESWWPNVHWLGSVFSLGGLVTSSGRPWLAALILLLAGFAWAIVRPPLSVANRPGLGRGTFGAVWWAVARWPLAVLGFAIVGPPSILGWIARRVAQVADLVEEFVALAGRTISRVAPVTLADPNRTFALPKVRPNRDEVGLF